MLYIFLATIFYTGAIMMGAIASRLINSSIVSAISNSISAILPIIVVLPLVNKRVIENGKLGILSAICAGICIAFFALSINKSFQVNKVAIVSPIVFGGMIFLTAILSYFFLKEKLTPVHLVGLSFLGVGLILIIYSAFSTK